MIKFGILDGLEDKEGEFFIKTLHDLKICTSLQEDLIEVEMLGKETGWPITDRLLELNNQLNQILAEEPSISEILTHPLTTDIKFLLESVISQMKTATQTYTKELREARKDKI